MIENKKCTNCGCTELKLIEINGPTDDGAFDFNNTFGGHIYTFECEKCGHIEFFKEKKEKQM